MSGPTRALVLSGGAAVIGISLMDPSGVPDAAAAGRSQGKKEAERIGRLWT